MNWFFRHYRAVARVLSWIGILAIIVLSVVPADERPVTGVGHLSEHVVAFALVAAAFAIGYYRFSLWRLGLLAFLFCGGIELIQIPLPTRHARVSDFVIDLIASCFTITIVYSSNLMTKRSPDL